MKKILAEFKAFITRGSVIDLAVGMIIGAAFTAIVSSLVTSIFQPLINCIPMGDVSGLISVLVARDANGVATTDMSLVDLSKSVYIDWGAFIMAIVNFFITAVILFIIVKIFNGVRDGVEGVKIDLDRAEIKRLRAAGLTHKQIKEYAELKAKDEAEKAAAEEAANAPETTDQMLCDVRDLLRHINPDVWAQIVKEREEAAEKAAAEKAAEEAEAGPNIYQKYKLPDEAAAG